MTTRGTLRATVRLLLLAGMLVAASRLDADAIGGLNTVTVGPTHGKADVPFQVTYAVSPCVGAASLTITFSWAALPAAGQVLGTAATDSACRATLSAAPPFNAATHRAPAPGTYQVFGYVALPTGIPAPNTQASASYTIDVTPPAATASSSATSKPSTSDNTAASPSASGVNDFPAGAAFPSTSQPLWWKQARPLAYGGLVLALLIVALIGFLAGWLIRRRRRARQARFTNDRAA
jgi:hypothetical protein